MPFVYTAKVGMAQENRNLATYVRVRPMGQKMFCELNFASQGDGKGKGTDKGELSRAFLCN